MATLSPSRQHTPFSSQFYATLTFGNLLSTTFPSVILPSAIRSFAIVNSNTASLNSIPLDPSRPIPHLAKALEILKEFQASPSGPAGSAEAHVFGIYDGKLTRYAYTESQVGIPASFRI